jgi:hypothetical protein
VPQGLQLWKELAIMPKPFPSLVVGALVAVGLSTPAIADTAMEEALAAGAERMTADEIAERLAGKTVTFELAATGDRFLIYYDGANGILMRKAGSEVVIEGFYATSVADHVCLGAGGDEPIRLRCMNVLLIDGEMHKFELDGAFRGRVVDEVDGNIT